MHWIQAVWNGIPTEVIGNCCKHCGFGQDETAFDLDVPDVQFIE